MVGIKRLGRIRATSLAIAGAVATAAAAAQAEVPLPIAVVITPQTQQKLVLNDVNGSKTFCYEYKAAVAFPPRKAYVVTRSLPSLGGVPRETGQFVEVRKGCTANAQRLSLWGSGVGDVEGQPQDAELSPPPAGSVLKLGFARQVDAGQRRYFAPKLVLLGQTTFDTAQIASRRAIGQLGDATVWARSPYWRPDAPQLKVVAATGSVPVLRAEPTAFGETQRATFRDSITALNATPGAMQAFVAVTADGVPERRLTVVDGAGKVVYQATLPGDGGPVSRPTVWGRYLLVAAGSTAYVFDMVALTIASDGGPAPAAPLYRFTLSRLAKQVFAPLVLPDGSDDPLVVFGWRGGDVGGFLGVHPKSGKRVKLPFKDGAPSEPVLVGRDASSGIAFVQNGQLRIAGPDLQKVRPCAPSDVPVSNILAGADGLLLWGSGGGRLNAVMASPAGACPPATSVVPVPPLLPKAYDLVADRNGGFFALSSGSSLRVEISWPATTVPAGVRFDAPTAVAASSFAFEPGVSFASGVPVRFAVAGK